MVNKMDSLEKKIQILANVDSSATITALAARLYLSQPYVSRLLKEMEGEYGVALVARTTKPIHLTHAGAVVLNDLRQIQNARAQMHQNLRNLQRRNDHEVTVVLNSTICESDVVNLSAGLIQRFPQARFNLVINGRPPQETDLVDKNIDILVGPKWNNQLFSIRPLQLNQLALLIPATSPLYRPGRRYCPFSEDHLTLLNNTSYVETNDNFFLQRRVNRFLADNGIHVNRLTTVSSTRLATKITIQEGVTTITTCKIAQHALGDRPDYNLMRFPKTALNLEIAISMRRDASPTVRAAADYLYQRLKRI